MTFERDVICGVYAIICIVDGSMYVGSSTDIRRRWVQHRSMLRGGRSSCAGLQRAWNQHPEQFSFAVLRECPERLLFQVEQEYIDWLKPVLNTADTNGRYRMTAEQRDRLKQRPQSVAMLHEFEGEMLSVPEISRRLGVTPAGVYARIRAGRSAKPRQVQDFSQPIDIAGEQLTPKQIAERFDLPLTTVYSRLRLGWSGTALTQPRKHRARNSRG